MGRAPLQELGGHMHVCRPHLTHLVRGVSLAQDKEPIRWGAARVFVTPAVWS